MRILSKPNKVIDLIKDLFISKIWTWLILLFLLYIFHHILVSQNILLAYSIASLPFFIILLFLVIAYSEKGFFPVFLSHFILLTVSSYIDIKLGAITALTSLGIFMLIIIKGIYNNINWKSSINAMLIFYLIWLIYCTLELTNPNVVFEAWNISITQYAIYPIVCAILVPISINKKIHIYILLYIWSVFIIFASLKGYYQKNYGFNDRELYFLFELGGATTHIIWSGIRYFSIFSDATNFGIHMGMASITFFICSIYAKNILTKIYFLIIVCAATYGMFISGTRASIAVPLVGLIYFITVSKKLNILIGGSFFSILIVCFFTLTSIGDSNPYIRRMRTAFSPTEDSSFQVRDRNREIMKTYMRNKPFGYGLGLGGKAERYKPKETIPVPPDSWLVSVWTDTGIVGLILYLTIQLILFIKSTLILLFKIKDYELKGLLIAWMSMAVAYFFITYSSDVMQYPNSIVFFTSIALCINASKFDRQESNLPV
ncbi:MAG: O-antigen ligase family protein [Thomasclavelia ramosa]|nr:O-antigen ligase family protein [Thomasclavelia ramosa]MDD8056555.1 O-antigen ligase family protein [Thomasclavelia ramosa]